MKTKSKIVFRTLLIFVAEVMLGGCGSVGSGVNEYPKMEGLMVPVVKVKKVYLESPELDQLGVSEMRGIMKVYYPKKYDRHVPESIHEARALIAEYFPHINLNEEEGSTGGAFSMSVNADGVVRESDVVVEGNIFRWDNQICGVPVIGDLIFIQTMHGELDRIGVIWHEVIRRGKPNKVIDPKSLDGRIQDIVNHSYHVTTARLCYKIENTDDVEVTARPVWEFTINTGGSAFALNTILIFDAITGEFKESDYQL